MCSGGLIDEAGLESSNVVVEGTLWASCCCSAQQTSTSGEPVVASDIIILNLEDCRCRSITLVCHHHLELGRSQVASDLRAEARENVDLGSFFTSTFFVSSEKRGPKNRIVPKSNVPVFPSQEIVTTSKNRLPLDPCRFSLTREKRERKKTGRSFQRCPCHQRYIYLLHHDAQDLLPLARKLPVL